MAWPPTSVPLVNRNSIQCVTPDQGTLLVDHRSKRIFRSRMVWSASATELPGRILSGYYLALRIPHRGELPRMSAQTRSN